MPPKIIRLVVWFATTALAIILLASGGAKLAGSEAQKEIFIDFGWPDPIFFVTGLAEVLAAVGLLIRQFRVAACAVIAFIMIGAAVTNIATGAADLASFNLILIVTCGALAWNSASAEDMSVKEALLTTGRWKPPVAAD